MCIRDRRRVLLDLTGLPDLPGLPEDADGTLDHVIEFALNSPHYGEHWGRHWLDVARWAESNGHQHNRHRPHAWRYRDYVVTAFQNHLPFNAFVEQQLAGDLLEGNGALVATGFLAAARYSGNELDKATQRNDILVDVANTTARAFLGLTLSLIHI